MSGEWLHTSAVIAVICIVIFLRGLVRALPDFTMNPPVRYRLRINNAMKRLESDPTKTSSLILVGNMAQ